ncbi:AHNK protein, partial [Myiagra hebetior]|nr:AHNK protein [Myiagra hebetior]
PADRVLAQMEREEETREILLPNWQGSGSHGITIDQTDDGVFVRRVQQNSPAARMGVVKEGDQIVSATVYFDNLQSGEVAQLLQTMGHHTQPPGAHGDVSHPQSGDDEEYQRIYTTKIKPRLRSEEGLDTEGGGTQSRTITVTRKVTAYTVDVTRHDGDLEVLGGGPDFNVRTPTLELGTTSGADAGKSPSGPGGLHLRTPTEPALPQSQIPAGETGISIPGWRGSGAFPGSPRIEANGQMGELDMGFHATGPHVSGGAPCPQGEAAGSSPPVDVGKIKIPALKIPKFGFQAGGEAPTPGMDVTCSPGVEVSSPSIKAPAPQVDVAVKSGTKVPSPALDVPGVEAPAPDGAKGKIKIPHMTFPKFTAADATVEVPKGGAVPEVALEGEWKGPTFKKVETPQISLSDVNLNLRGPRVEGDLKGLGPKGLQVDVKGPEVQVAGPGCGLKGVEVDVDVKGLKGGVDVSVPTVGGELRGPQLDLKGPQIGVEVPGVDIKGPAVKMPEMSIKTPQISVPDVDLNLKGPGVKGNLDISAPKLEGELKTPGLDVKGPKVEVGSPEMEIQGPEGKLKFPKLKMPKFGVKGETPSVDVTLPKGAVDVSGPKVDVSGPKVDISGPKVDVSAPSVDIKGPKVDIEAPEVDIHSPEGKFKMPKFKMPKFGMPGVKAEGSEVDVNLPKGGVEVSSPKVDIEAPSLDIQGPEMHLKATKIS